jgi:hypothetical protein
MRGVRQPHPTLPKFSIHLILLPPLHTSDIMRQAFVSSCPHVLMSTCPHAPMTYALSPHVVVILSHDADEVCGQESSRQNPDDKIN